MATRRRMTIDGRGLPMPEQTPLTELYPGMQGYFVPGEYQTKGNDKAQTPRQLFVRIGRDGKEVGSYYFDPKGKFTNMMEGANLHQFISDPDTFDPKNPSGFESGIYNVLQQYKSDPMGLIGYARQNPGFGVWKQETAR